MNYNDFKNKSMALTLWLAKYSVNVINSTLENGLQFQQNHYSVLLALSSFFHENKPCYPNQTTILKKAGFKDRGTVGKILNKLEEMSLIRIKKPLYSPRTPKENRKASEYDLSPLFNLMEKYPQGIKKSTPAECGFNQHQLSTSNNDFKISTESVQNKTASEDNHLKSNNSIDIGKTNNNLTNTVGVGNPLTGKEKKREELEIPDFREHFLSGSADALQRVIESVYSIYEEYTRLTGKDVNQFIISEIPQMQSNYNQGYPSGEIIKMITNFFLAQIASL